MDGEKAILLAAFQDNTYPKKDKVVELSETLSATPEQIRAWFVNKRQTEGIKIKHKKG